VLSVKRWPETSSAPTYWCAEVGPGFDLRDYDLPITASNHLWVRFHDSSTRFAFSNRSQHFAALFEPGRETWPQYNLTFVLCLGLHAPIRRALGSCALVSAEFSEGLALLG
jgi:hypothetical protein